MQELGLCAEHGAVREQPFPRMAFSLQRCARPGALSPAKPAWEGSRLCPGRQGPRGGVRRRSVRLAQPRALSLPMDVYPRGQLLLVVV